MSNKYQRPVGAYAGSSGLGNRTKYQDDANAVPKRAISSSKIDGDFNYLVDAINQLDDASGSRASVAERLDVALNPDGTLKASVAGALDEFVVHAAPGTLARVDNSTFTLAGGDFRGIYTVNRRVRVTVAGVALVGDVASCSFAGGITTVSAVDLVDLSGALGVISVAPTQVAYGPLTTGRRGNTPRRVDALVIPASGAEYSLQADVADLVVRRAGSVVARIASGGVSGLASASVASAALSSDVVARLVPAGSVVPFAGSSAPTGWLLCGGQAVSRTTFAALFAVIGTTYGAGDGSTTFGLPDLRGRAVFGVDNMDGTAANRVTSGVSGIAGTTLGAAGGNQAMQSHTHTVTDPGHSHTDNRYLGSAAGAANGGAATGNNSFDGTTSVATTGITLASTGAGSSQNMPPAMMLNYIIKT
ncbi:MAG: hypothetical protein EBR79_01305 [Proteobacteria bacterium]|nr:hypothetical protein [Pseudomonadota bacterium]NBX85882.1 hypothetical protein [Pseudomonadota bacterium]